MLVYAYAPHKRLKQFLEIVLASVKKSHPSCIKQGRRGKLERWEAATAVSKQDATHFAARKGQEAEDVQDSSNGGRGHGDVTEFRRVRAT